MEAPWATSASGRASRRASAPTCSWCVGAALFVLIPQQAGAAPGDITRVIQGVVAGIGFLGAGTILKDDDHREVRGLTTAAGVWLTAAIGVAAGMGRVGSAVLSTALALVILSMLPKFAALSLSSCPCAVESRDSGLVQAPLDRVHESPVEPQAAISPAGAVDRGRVALGEDHARL